LLWTSFEEEERAWVNRTELIGMFKIEWKTHHHNILVEFLNNLKLDPEHNKIKVMLGEEQRIIYKCVLVEVFRICCTVETKVDRAKMSNPKVTLDRVLNIYNTNE
jgi:hypothetical protein